MVVEEVSSERHAVDGVADMQREAVSAGLETEVMGGDVRIGQHHVVVERAADAHRPGADRPRLAHMAVAVDDLEQRERWRGARLRVAAGGRAVGGRAAPGEL